MLSSNTDLKERKLTFTAMANQWKDISLMSYAAYRWVLRNQNKEEVEILTESKSFLANLGLKPVEQLEEYNNYLDLRKGQLWDVFRANQEVFFVRTKDGAITTVNANEMEVELKKLRDALKFPEWWPAHFATPDECDDWVDNKIKLIDEEYALKKKSNPSNSAAHVSYCPSGNYRNRCKLIPSLFLFLQESPRHTFLRGLFTRFRLYYNTTL